MRRGHGVCSPIANEHRHAVGRLNRDNHRRIVRQDDVSLRRRGARRRPALLIGDDVSAVNLMEPAKMRGVDASGGGDFRPAISDVSGCPLAEVPRTRREEVRGEGRKRVADERRAA